MKNASGHNESVTSMNDKELWIGSDVSTAVGTTDEFCRENQIEHFVDSIAVLINNQLVDDPRLPATEHIQFLAAIVANPEAMYSTLGREYATGDLCASRKALMLLRRMLRVSKHPIKHRLRIKFRDAFKIGAAVESDQSQGQEHAGRRNHQRLSRKNRTSFYGDVGNSITDEIIEGRKEENDSKTTEFDIDDMLSDLAAELGSGDSDVDSEDSDNYSQESAAAELEMRPPVPTYEHRMPNLFSSGTYIWRMVGWAFTCATIGVYEYQQQWHQWELLLEFLADLIDDDLAADSSEEDTQSIIENWTSEVGLADVIHAILAAVEERDTEPGIGPHGLNYSNKLMLQFKPILEWEKQNLPKLNDQSKLTESRFDPTRVATLRSRFLDALFKMDPSEQHGINVREQCRTILQNDKIHRALLGPEFFGYYSSASAPNTLSRLVWSTYLDAPGYIDYVRQIPLDHEVIQNILKSVPSRCVYVDYVQVATGFLVCLYDAFLVYLRSWLQNALSHNRKQLKHAYEYGRQERSKWYKRKRVDRVAAVVDLERSLGQLVYSVVQ